jgi:WD40 repeat protein
MLAAYSDWSDLITIWDAHGAIVQQIHRQGDHFLIGNPLAFVAHDSEIAARPVKMSAADVVVSVFDIRTGAVVHELPSQQPGQPAEVQSALALASSPDGSLLALAFGGGEAEPVALYDTESWSKLADIPNRDQLQSIRDQAKAVAFSRNRRYLAIGTGGGYILIYDVHERRVAQRFAAFSAEQELSCCISAVSFNADATEVAVSTGLRPGSVNGPQGLKPFAPKAPVRVIRVADGTTIASYPDPLFPAYAMSWSPDGKVIGFIIGDKLYVWEPSAPTRHQTISIRSGGVSLAFAPDSKKLAVANGYYVTVFDVCP